MAVRLKEGYQEYKEILCVVSYILRDSRVEGKSKAKNMKCFRFH